MNTKIKLRREAESFSQRSKISQYIKKLSYYQQYYKEFNLRQR